MYVLDYVRRFATEEALLEKDAITGMGATSASSGTKASNGAASDTESSMSEFSDDEAHDMEL